MADATFAGQIQQPKLRGRTLFIHAGLPTCFQLFSSSSSSSDDDDDYFAIHDVSSSQRVVTGEATFSLPVYLRRDGLALRVGQIIVHNGGRFAVRNILVTSGKYKKCNKF